MVSSLLISLPLACFLVLFRLNWSKDEDGRMAFLRASIVWAVLAAAITEALGAFAALDARGLGWSWAAANLVGLMLLRRKIANAIPAGRAPAGEAWDAMSGVLAAGGIAIIAVIGLIAITAPPNTVDVMEYHLPRIVQWLHQRGTAFYATHDLRQIKMPPWAEYAMLQFHGLSGGDRFDNLVQWFSLGGTAVAVSLIARRLGGGLRGQILSAVLSLTIPQGLLDASGAKNDYVVAYWLATAIYFLLSLGAESAWREAVWLGCAFGLACYTKTTAVVVGLPVIAVTVLAAPGAGKVRRLNLVAAAGLIALAINGLHLWRNGQQNDPAVPAATFSQDYTNNRLGVSITASNVLRNVALHVSTPVKSWNAKLEEAIVGAIRLMGQDPNDPRTTWLGSEFHVGPMTLHETTAGNLLHAVLVLLVLGLLVRRPAGEHDRRAMSLALGLAAGFVLFCAVLKWQPWHTRLHLPFFVAFAGIAGAVLSQRLPSVASGVVGIVALLAAVPYVLANPIRPLLPFHGPNVFTIPRAEQYFSDRRHLFEPYRDAARFAVDQKCGKVGLDFSVSNYEYPLFALFRDLDGTARISFVNVQNESRRYSRGEDAVGCVICPGCGLQTPAWALHQSRYGKARMFQEVAVLGGTGTGDQDGCWAEFSGWYGTERERNRWWRWSEGRGIVRISASKDLQISLEGGVLTAPDPNFARLTLNGNEVLRLALSGRGEALLAGTTLHLRKGINRLEFVSEQPPVKPPAESRQLAIAIRDLVLRPLNERACELNP